MSARDFHRATSRPGPGPPERVVRERRQEPPREYASAPLVRFPPPTDRHARRSCRAFAATPVALAHLGEVLHAAYGITGHRDAGQIDILERSVPSAGALYPLELYLLVHRAEGLASGRYHYAPVHHGLELLGPDLPATQAADLFYGQDIAAAAAVVVIVAAVLERITWKYGDRGYRYALFEAGHAAQSLDAAASARSLGTCHLGAFRDEALAATLGLDPEGEPPLYATALGPPA
jgi:SagB-type dehydrogenase family enzyme